MSKIGTKLLITGSGGLVGSAAVEYFDDHDIIGVDNDSRGKMLRDDRATTKWNTDRLEKLYPNFSSAPIDIRDKPQLYEIFKNNELKAIIHCAAQTSHGGEVREDFSVNAIGTLNLLELWREHCPEAVFVYMSTIKVYGNYPNTLDYTETTPLRYGSPVKHPNGFNENVSIDQGTSSFFGRSKTAADLYVQEFAYQYGLKAACFRASCLTGGYHAGVEAHGMLSYLMYCARTQTPYRIFGYNGLQVRDQLHAHDMVTAMNEVINQPKSIVYNIGGGLQNSCSMLEAIALCEEITGNKIRVSYHEERTGDHKWWVTDNTKFERDYPNWQMSYTLANILQDLYERGEQRGKP